MYLNAEAAEIGKIYLVDGLGCKIKIISKSIFPGGECLSVLIDDEREPGFPYRISATTRLVVLPEAEQKFSKAIPKPLPSAPPLVKKVADAVVMVTVPDAKTAIGVATVAAGMKTTAPFPVEKKVIPPSPNKVPIIKAMLFDSTKTPPRSSVIDKLLSVVADGVIPDWKLIEDAVIAQCGVAEADRGKIRNQSKIRWKWYTAEGQINPFLRK